MLISSVLHHSSEIQGNKLGIDIEYVHTKFLCKVLRVHKSTNVSALYSEIGRPPMNIIRKLNMMHYWIKILNLDNDKSVKIIHNMQQNDAKSNFSYNWAYQLKDI